MSRCGCRFARGRGGSEREIRDLLSRFDEDDIDLRDRAQRSLEEIGTDAVPYLRPVAKWGEPEAASRCSEALKRILTGDVELTGLALLAFLAAGHTHLTRAFVGDGIQGGDIVCKAIRWFLSRQKENGGFGAEPVHEAIATTALLDACVRTRSTLFRNETERAMRHLLELSSGDGRFIAWRQLASLKSREAGLPCVLDDPWAFRGTGSAEERFLSLATSGHRHRPSDEAGHMPGARWNREEWRRCGYGSVEADDDHGRVRATAYAAMTHELRVRAPLTSQ